MYNIPHLFNYHIYAGLIHVRQVLMKNLLWS